MKEGSAEIFGTEMIKDTTYTFGTGAKLAIFTYHGCVIQMKGKGEEILECRSCMEDLKRI